MKKKEIIINLGISEKEIIAEGFNGEEFCQNETESMCIWIERAQKYLIDYLDFLGFHHEKEGKELKKFIRKVKIKDLISEVQDEI